MGQLRHSPLVLAGAAILAAALCAAEATRAPERVVVVVRVGKLAEAEISPSPVLKVPALWKLALEGVSLTRIELTGGARVPNTLEELRNLVLPEGQSGELFNWMASSPDRDSLGVLRELFGAPPAIGAEEQAEVESLREALGASRALAPGPQTDTTVTSSDLSWLSRSAVTLVRVEAVSDVASEVGLRDDLLEKIIAGAGPAANIVVINLPERGAGTLIARGPRLKRARVSERTRSLAALRGLVALLLDPTAGEKNPTIREELVHEVFR